MLFAAKEGAWGFRYLLTCLFSLAFIGSEGGCFHVCFAVLKLEAFISVDATGPTCKLPPRNKHVSAPLHRRIKSSRAATDSPASYSQAAWVLSVLGPGYWGRDTEKDPVNGVSVLTVQLYHKSMCRCQDADSHTCTYAYIYEINIPIHPYIHTYLATYIYV